MNKTTMRTVAIVAGVIVVNNILESYGFGLSRVSSIASGRAPAVGAGQ